MYATFIFKIEMKFAMEIQFYQIAHTHNWHPIVIVRNRNVMYNFAHLIFSLYLCCFVYYLVSECLVPKQKLVSHGKSQAEIFRIENVRFKTICYIELHNIQRTTINKKARGKIFGFNRNDARKIETFVYNLISVTSLYRLLASSCRMHTTLL